MYCKPLIYSVFTLFLVVPFSNAASDSKPVFLLGVEAVNYAPYLYKKNNEVVGIEVDAIKAVLNKMGFNVKIKQANWSKLMLNLLSGKIDGLANVFRTPERETFAYFPQEAVSIQVQGLVVPADSTFSWSGNISQLSGLTMGAVKGASYGPSFDYGVNANVVRLSTSDLVLLNIAEGKLDLAIEDWAVLCSRSKTLGIADKIRLLSPPINQEKTYLAFSKKNTREAVVKQFSEHLTAFKKTKEWQEIINRHVEKHCWAPDWGDKD